MTGGAPEVSVALCTHNGERFIAEQLLSILNQSRLPREIVLSDDASTDATVAIAETTFATFAAAHSHAPVELTVLRNGVAFGVTKNFEQAILACRSDLVALCDQDDVWMPHRLERLVGVFAARPRLQLVHSDARLIDDSGEDLGETLFEAYEVTAELQNLIHSGAAFTVLMHRNVVTGATVVMRRELAAAAAPFPANWVHDEWLAVVAATLGELDLVADQLIDYRQHGGNAIGARRLSFAGKFARMVEPGAKRNARLLARATSLAERLRDLGDLVPSERLAATEHKLRHEEARSELSVHRAARVVPVLRELRTGRYGEFGRGVSDAVRDLLQPLGTSR